MSTLTPERRQEIVRAAHQERNAAIRRLMGRLLAALKGQPKLRPSRWLAVHHGR